MASSAATAAANAVHALRGIDLALPRGSFTAVMGPSGSGKSTFLQCAAGLDRPTGGRGPARRHRAHRPEREQADHGCAAAGSASSSSPSTCCPRSPSSRTCCCRCGWPAPGPTASGPAAAGPGRARRPRAAPPGAAVRRPAAAGGHRPRPGHQPRRWSSPTSRPAPWTPAPAARCSACCGTRSTRSAQTVVMVTHDPVAASLRRPGGLPRRRMRGGPAAPAPRRRDRRPDDPAHRPHPRRCPRPPPPRRRPVRASPTGWPAPPSASGPRPSPAPSSRC